MGTARQGRVAIVTAGLQYGGGVPAVVKFLRDGILRKTALSPTVIDLATSWRDARSRRLSNPKTWSGYPVVARASWGNEETLEVGATWSELEFQRYRPRRVLTELLNDFHFVQVVAGTPAWCNVARDARRPVLLQVATRSVWERESLIKQAPLLTRLRLRVITSITNNYDLLGCRVARHIFTENARMEGWLRSAGGDAHVHFAPPGIDCEAFRPGAREGRYVLSVGRLGDPRKNFGLLLRAYAALLHRPNMGDVKVILAGYGTLSVQHMRYIAEQSLQDKVRICENVSADALRRLYQGASVFALSSNEEGLGIVILEAMACGLPVVATRCGGPEMVVEDGVSGVLTPVGEVAQLRDSLYALLANEPLALQMGARGREVVVAQFSKEAAFRRFAEVYARLPI